MIPLKDFWVVVQCAALGALVVAALGLGLAYLLRGRSIAIQLGLVAVATVLTTAAGIVLITFKMMISEHDRSVALTVVAVAGMVGLGVAVVVGCRFIVAGRALVGSVHTAGEQGSYTAPKMRLPAELAELSDEMAIAYERLAGAHTRERALESSRRDLVAWVSHDLRTPLAGLRAMAEALEDDLITDKPTMRRYHGQIRVEVDRLSAMVDDLFELSRIHAGALRLSPRPIGLDDLIAEAVAGTEPLARAKGVRIHGHGRPGTPVQADAAELGRAVRNLMVNAIRHTPSDGAVEVIAGVQGGMACVTVSDACGGIPEDDLPRVFDVAFRGEAARSPGGGAGLGLAIARGIVEAHAGQIGVRNAGSGCSFEIRLPLPVPS